MKPIVIGIAGAHSGVGKTTAACRILKRLHGWGAVKYTGTRHERRLVEERDLLNTPGKDTAQMLDSGAVRVIWIEASRSALPGMIEQVRTRMQGLPGFLVEGNSAAALLQPDLTIFVADGDKIKKGAERLLRSADIILHRGTPPSARRTGVACFHMDDPEFGDYLLKTLARISEKRSGDPVP